MYVIKKICTFFQYTVLKFYIDSFKIDRFMKKSKLLHNFPPTLYTQLRGVSGLKCARPLAQNQGVYVKIE